MTITANEQSVFVYARKDFLVRRNTNTIAIELDGDEVLAVIRDLAGVGRHGAPVYLVVESDKIYAKDME